MKPPLLLYSTSTWLAYSVAEQFYGGVHFAWCSPVNDGRLAGAHVNIPPSASPAALYRRLLDDAQRGDQHSTAINLNKDGIDRGAKARRSQGLIGDDEVSEIWKSLERAECRDFPPVAIHNSLRAGERDRDARAGFRACPPHVGGIQNRGASPSGLRHDRTHRVTEAGRCSKF